MAMRESAPAAPVSPTPVLGGFPAAIARAGLGAASEAADGSSTVTFPAPGVPEYIPFSTTPVTVSRSIFDDATAAVSGAAHEAAEGLQDRAEGAVADAGEAVQQHAGAALDQARSAAAGAIQGAMGGAQPDIDKQFDDLLDRLKRELLIEQEQRNQNTHEM
jgi:uncharacterized protein YjbJ (UPF0337 family)